MSESASPDRAPPPARHSAADPAGPGMVGASFLLLGLGFQLFFAAGLVRLPGLWLDGERGPLAAAVLHAAVLGWLLPAGFGLLHGLLPRLGRPDTGAGSASQGHFLFHVFGLALIVPAFARWDMVWVARGGGAIFGAFVLCALLAVTSLERGRRLPLVQITVASALCWLLLTLGLGVLAALDHYWMFLPTGTAPTIHAGLHAGFGGYLVLLVIGLSYPLFLRAGPRSPARRTWVLLLGNGGLYLGTMGLAFGLPFEVPAALLLVAATLLYLVEALVGLEAGSEGVDAWGAGLLAGFAALFLLLGLGLALNYLRGREAAAAGRLENLYGFLWIVLGAGLPLGALAGRAFHPAAGRRSGTILGLLLQLAAAGAAGWGILTGAGDAIQAGGLLLLAGALLFFAPLGRPVRAAFAGRAPAPVPTSPSLGAVPSPDSPA